MFMNTRTFLARLLAFAIGFLIAYTIISKMVDEIQRGVFVFTQFFGYFTIQSGTLTAIVMLVTAFASSKVLQSSVLDFARGAVTLYMSVVIIVYHILESPPGTWVIDDWSTIHVFAPIASLLIWFALLPPNPRHVKWWWSLSWMLFPLVFAIASVIRGMNDGWYPYDFLNVNENGLQFVVMMVVGLTVGVAVLGYALLAPSLIQHRRLVKSEKKHR